MGLGDPAWDEARMGISWGGLCTPTLAKNTQPTKKVGGVNLWTRKTTNRNDDLESRGLQDEVANADKTCESAHRRSESFADFPTFNW